LCARRGSLGLAHGAKLCVGGGYHPGLGRGLIPGSIFPVDDFCGRIRLGGGKDVRCEVFGVMGGVGIEKTWALLVGDCEGQKGEARELPSEER